MEAIEKACRATHDGTSSNAFRVGSKSYFYEVNRQTHVDGSITGTIHLDVGHNMARQVGTFKIDGQGNVVRGPKFWKSL
ncbi:MAG: hypothetical protein K2R98_19380 [Gemmataceae bacterium]|nr:hypothetical protein [Gemmataceae bacterium]